MKQSRLESLVESLLNIAIGYAVAVVAQLAIYPMFGIDISFTSNLAVGACFTAISLVRSYVIRRWFNARLHAASQRMAIGRRP